MYVHIGGDYTLATDYIVGIFDFDLLSHYAKSATLDILAKNDLPLENIGGSLPLSIVVAVDRIYLSPLSVTVLRQRLRRNSFVE